MRPLNGLRAWRRGCGTWQWGADCGGGGGLRGLEGRGNSAAGVVNRMLYGLKSGAFAGEVGI